MPGTPPVTAAATFCATLVDEWVRCGVRHAVVCPGSRSTPLALALSDHPGLTVHVHHDERAGAFLALGLGLATGMPAPVLTTSGTAAVELHPAVVEADLARVPLLACTADRPPELQGVGAPQTIDQRQLYGSAVRWFADPGPPEDSVPDDWRPLAARALAATLGPPAGPVQLNLAFRDPLVGTPGPLPDSDPAIVPTGAPPTGTPDPAWVAGLVERAGGRPGVIVAGGRSGDPTAVLAAATRLGWPVLADPRSGGRVPHPAVIAHADLLARRPDLLPDPPGLVLRLGTPPASKALGAWLAGLDAVQVAVDADGWRYDPDHVLDELVAADPAAFVTALAEVAPAADPAHLAAWRAADDRCAAHLEAVLAAEGGCTEPGVARQVLAGLPDGASLVVSSSMPVRDLEWYGRPRTGVQVLANRGANGIDGVVSTAVGVALAGGPTAVLVGDVAFLHDTNALLGLARRAVEVVVVVVDNDGGGIFSFLPPAAALAPERFETLFGTPHGVDPLALAAAHGVPGRALHADADVAAAVGECLAAGGPHVLVARTDRAANVALHDRLHALD